MPWTLCLPYKSIRLVYALAVLGGGWVCAPAYANENSDETTDETTEEKNKPGIYASMKEGLRIRTLDKRYVFKLGGHIQIDSHSYAYPADGLWKNEEQNNHVFDVRRARLELGVTLSKYYQAKLTAEFANKVELNDAYINLRYFPAMEIRVGQFIYPFGTEGPTSAKFNEFAESTTIGSAVGSGRDRGLMLFGDTKNNRYMYQFAIMNGVPENTSNNSDDIDLAVRFVRNPEEVIEEEWNVWYGLSYSQGGQLARKGKALSLRSESKSGYAFLRAELAEDTKYSRQRMALNVTTVKGSGLFKGEYYSASYDFAAKVKLQGYYLIASYFLTGEQRAVDNGLFDRQPIINAYAPGGGGGAWELAVRYSVFYADRKFFEPNGLYAGWEALDPAENVNAGYTWVFGVNWYPDTTARFMLNWIQSYAADELARDLSDARSVKATKSESTLLLRAQLDF